MMLARYRYRVMGVFGILAALGGCGSGGSSAPPTPGGQAATVTSATAGPRPTSAPLGSNRGQEVGTVYEAFLSPHQEPGEEEDTPALTPKQFVSTAPSVPRSQRPSRGHGQLRFTKDMSRAFVDVQIEGLNVADINMFHIHCGLPDTLGPILVDFSLAGSLQDQLADGVLTLEITNTDLEKAKAAEDGFIGLFLADCPAGEGTTIAGLEYIARHGQLYFNLHTKGQTYFGEMRGQIHRAEP